MAAANSTRARGIKLTHCHWGIVASGSRDMLIEHGYAQASPWPGDPGLKKTVCEALDPQGREITIRRKSKAAYGVYRSWTDEEFDEIENRKAKQKEIEEAVRRVNSWPKSGDAFRKQVRWHVESITRMLELLIRDGQQSGGYRFDDAGLLRLELISDQLLDLVDTGAVVKDLALREQATPACIAKTVKALDGAKMDKTFQRFLAGVAR